MASNDHANGGLQDYARLLDEARTAERSDKPLGVILASYLAASAADPARAEALHGAARLCRNNKLYEAAYRFASQGLAIPRPANVLPDEAWIYDFGLMDECAVSAYWVGRFDESLQLCNTLLSNGVPDRMVERVRKNAELSRRNIFNRTLLDVSDGSALRPLSGVRPQSRRPAAKTAENAPIRQKPEIVRTIHIVWVGDESRRPEQCIQTWERMNPGWEVVIWGNDELRYTNWTNRKHIATMLTRELPGVADMMRWDILYQHGGFAVDADSVCVRPLEDWLFEPEVFACWESEFSRPGLIANCHVYSRPGNRLMKELSSEIYRLPNLDGGLAWQLTGPTLLTETVKKMKYTDITVYPSHFFMPEHHTGVAYSGTGPVFARHFWGGADETVYDRLITEKREHV